jgi:tetratricopeptide (TPR) repeat protein
MAHIGPSTTSELRPWRLLLPALLCLSLQDAAAFQTSDTAAQANRALTYQRAGELDKAIATYSALDAAAKAQHKSLPSAVLANYARALAATGHLEGAAAEMKAAIAGDPRNATFEDDLGSIYARQQQWPEAQSHFAAATKLAPTLATAHLHLGLAMQAQGAPEALHELGRAAKLAPQNSAIAFEYGKALASSGDDAQATSVFQAILARHNASADPILMDTTYALALALQRTGKISESIPLLRTVLTKQPNNAEAMINLGMALSQTQQTAQALPVLQRAVALAPSNVVAHQDLAAALVQLNQFADAIVELRAALALAPDLSQLHYDLGFAYKMQDDAANAIPELEAAERLDPQQAESPYLLGVLYMQTGRYEDAARELKTALTLHPQNGDGWATLGSVYSKLDKLPEATAALEEAIKQLPQQPDPHLTLAGVLVKQNRPAEATEQRKQAAVLMKQNMNRQRAEVATHAGESQLKSGDLAGATVEFNDALSYDADYAEAHIGLSKVYDAQGKKIEAAAERQKAQAAKLSSSTR